MVRVRAATQWLLHPFPFPVKPVSILYLQFYEKDPLYRMKLDESLQKIIMRAMQCPQHFIQIISHYQTPVRRHI